MSDTLQPSPMLEAIDLIRVNLNSLSDEELDEHAERVVAVLLAIGNAQAQATWTSAIAAANIAMLAKKLLAHLARVKEMIEARQVEAAEAVGEPPAAPAGRKQGLGRPTAPATNWQVSPIPRWPRAGEQARGPAAPPRGCPRASWPGGASGAARPTPVSPACSKPREA